MRRERTLQLVITFPTTTAAMEMESYAREAELPGRLIPLPTDISAGCGMAWKTQITLRERIAAGLADRNIRWEMMYEKMLF